VEKLNRARSLPLPGTTPGAIDRARAAAAISEFLRALGFAPEHEPDLADTARLVADAYADQLLVGYRQSAAEILSGNVSEVGSELVAVRDIQTTIMCPHHLMPATGVVHVAYAPGERVVGLGALGRLITCFARRLTLQESLVQSVVDALCAHAGARGAACVAELAPTCMTARAEHCHAARALSLATAGEMQPGRALHGAAIAALLPGRAFGGAP
jgi:GTP cyclohydrolase IA